MTIDDPQEALISKLDHDILEVPMMGKDSIRIARYTRNLLLISEQFRSGLLTPLENAHHVRAFDLTTNTWNTLEIS